MRKFRLSRLVLAATVIGVAGIFSLPAVRGGTEFNDSAAESHSAISHVDWTNADETYPFPPGSPTPSPSYDGDGTSDEGDGGDGGDGDGGDGASPDSGPKDSGGGDNEAGGMLGLSFPAQAGLSGGLLALAFLALLPGRRMPADLR
ncbi:MAG TPA: hypothetical protein VHG10_04195 [Glycomyces sp.]|nr:hypothetical protein [Glycomyces sp.]